MKSRYYSFFGKTLFTFGNGFFIFTGYEPFSEVFGRLMTTAVFKLP